MEKIHIAVLGCGPWGRNLINKFYSLDVLSAIYDPCADVVNKLDKNISKLYKTFEQILNDKNIHGVVIATPAPFHYEHAKLCLQYDKHVFVEKPLALQSSHAEELSSLAKSKNKILMVGHLMHYHNAFLNLKKLGSEGKFGKINYIYSNRLNFGRFRKVENILWSFAPHDISMILALTGSLPTSIYSEGVCKLSNSVEDITITHLDFEDNIQSHIFVSWLHPFKEQKLVVVGDKAMAVFNDQNDWQTKLAIHRSFVEKRDGLFIPSKEKPEYINLIEEEPLLKECKHFIYCIENLCVPVTDADESIKVLKVLEKANESLKLKSRTFLKPTAKKINYFIHNTSEVSQKSQISEGTKIWHFSHILDNVSIGKNCTIGQNVMIGPDVTVGDNCKIQNNVSLYKGVILENNVFCGPSCVFTNVMNPRSHVERKSEFLNTYVKTGVTIGANATIVCGVTLGEFCFIGAGAVVTKNIKPHALMVGNPAKQIGWMSHAGEKLDNNLICPREKRKYCINQDNLLQEIETEDVVAL